jgi:hypothetical protein
MVEPITCLVGVDEVTTITTSARSFAGRWHETLRLQPPFGCHAGSPNRLRRTSTLYLRQKVEDGKEELDRRINLTIPLRGKRCKLALVWPWVVNCLGLLGWYETFWQRAEMGAFPIQGNLYSAKPRFGQAVGGVPHSSKADAADTLLWNAPPLSRLGMNAKSTHLQAT